MTKWEELPMGRCSLLVGLTSSSHLSISPKILWYPSCVVFLKIAKRQLMMFIISNNIIVADNGQSLMYCGTSVLLDNAGKKN